MLELLGGGAGPVRAFEPDEAIPQTRPEVVEVGPQGFGRVAVAERDDDVLRARAIRFGVLGRCGAGITAARMSAARVSAAPGSATR